MKTILILLFVLGSSMAFAKSGMKMDHSKDHSHAGHKHKEGHEMKAGLQKLTPENALVKVQGMVCAFCAQGIEKNFNKLDEVKSTKVDLDKMEVFIEFNKGKSLSEKKIEEVVTGAGFAYKGLVSAK